MKTLTEKERLELDIKDITHDLRFAEEDVKEANTKADKKEAIRWRDNRKERLAVLKNQLKALKE